MPACYQDAGVEPSLEELLTDPIVLLLLERDRIDLAQLQDALASVRERLQPVDAPGSDRPQAA